MMKSSQLSYPNRPAAWRISPECCRLINDRHRQPEALVLFLRLQCEASIHKESRELGKKCPLCWSPSDSQKYKNTTNASFPNVEKKLVWVVSASKIMKCFLSLFTSFLHFVSENSSPHDFKPVFTVTIWLLFWKEQSRAFPFFIYSFSCKAQCDKTERRLPS